MEGELVVEQNEEMNVGIEVTEKKQTCFWTIEVFTLLSLFAQALTADVLTDLIAYRTCLVSLNTSEDECPVLRINSSSQQAIELEARIAPHASVIVMTKSLMGSILPALISLFVGAWSDKGGRKPPLIAVTVGYTLQYLMLSLMSIWNISPWYLAIALIPSNIVGGQCTWTIAAICYITETTSEKHRMLRLGLLEASICAGNVLGNIAGPLIYRNYGYTYVFGTAAVISGLAIFFIHFMISESVKNTSKESIRGLFRISLVTDLVKTSLVKRDGLDRKIVWLGMFVFTSSMMTLSAQQDIAFLFVRARLGWNVEQFSYCRATEIILRMSGVSLLSFLTTVSELADTSIATIALVSGVFGAITKSLTLLGWHMYLAVSLELFCATAGPAMRSMISKFAPTEDIGKLFSLTAFLEASSSLIGAPLYTMVFSSYLPPIYPTRVYILSAVLFALLIICVGFARLLCDKKPRDTDTYTPVSQDDEKSLQHR